MVECNLVIKLSGDDMRGAHDSILREHQTVSVSQSPSQRRLRASLTMIDKTHTTKNKSRNTRR